MYGISSPLFMHYAFIDSPAQVTEARAWLAEVFDIDTEYENWSNTRVANTIQSEYEGGLATFLESTKALAG